MTANVLAIADELAAAAGLLMGKAENSPVEANLERSNQTQIGSGRSFSQRI